MKKFSQHPLWLAVATTFLVSAPLAAMANDGAYVGVESGMNFLKSISGNRFSNDWVAGLNAGYAFESGWRPELELDFRRNDTTSASPFYVHATSETAMVNMWYDVKTQSGLFSVLHPYLGAGVGAARSEIVSNSGMSPYDTRLAYQAGAGLNYDLTHHWTASLDYRFLRTNHDRDASPGPLADYRYQTQSVMLGLRYSFGSAPVMVATAAPAPVSKPAPTPAPVCNPPAGFKVDADCHIIPQERVLRAVDFVFNSAQLTGPAQHTLDEVASALIAQPELDAEVQGHTDSVGSAAYNLKLSQRRADAVKTYLVSKGVNSANLTAHGFGKTHPIASNDTAEGRAQNRRVQFEVTNAPAHVKVINEGASSASTDAALQEQKKVEKHHHKKHHHKKAAAPAAAPAAPAAQ